MTITVGSNIRITIGTRQVCGRVMAIYNSNEASDFFHEATPFEYWDVQYTLPDGKIGRYKQNVDGGYLQLA